jgi:hypothetical protein
VCVGLRTGFRTRGLRHSDRLRIRECIAQLKQARLRGRFGNLHTGGLPPQPKTPLSRWESKLWSEGIPLVLWTWCGRNRDSFWVSAENTPQRIPTIEFFHAFMNTR